MIKTIKTSMLVFFAAAVFIFHISPLPAFAQERQLRPGEYIVDGGWGSLSIKPGKGGVLNFSILSIGGNAHTCSLNGEIHNKQATLTTDDKDKPCVVTFLPKGDDIDVTTNGMACQYFCGVRAVFGGLYIKPSRECTPLSVKKSRNEFQKLYNKKAYAQARLKLDVILKSCTRTLDWIETAWIRSDLAITQYKLHDLEGCRRTLQPLAQDAAKTDEELRGEYPPAEAEVYLPVVAAVRTNLKLCSKRTK